VAGRVIGSPALPRLNCPNRSESFAPGSGGFQGSATGRKRKYKYVQRVPSGFIASIGPRGRQFSSICSLVDRSTPQHASCFYTSFERSTALASRSVIPPRLAAAALPLAAAANGDQLAVAAEDFAWTWKGT
jgi:hypothetical protein